MDRIDILEQLLAMASDDVPTSGVEAGRFYPESPFTDKLRYVLEHRGTTPFIWGVHAGLFLALRILRLCQEMKHTACATRHGWTIQEPTFTDEKDVHPLFFVDCPVVEHFLNTTGESCQGEQ